MKKILYVTTLSMTVNAFLIPHIELLIDEGYEVHLACAEISKLSFEIKKLNIKIHEIPFNRSPLSIRNIYAFKKIKLILQQQDYDFVHVHTPIASAITRMASKKNSETKLLYTAHGFHFFKGAPIKNWIIYYPLEKYLSRKTDILITINEEDFEMAKTFHAKSVKKIPGVGVELNEYQSRKVDTCLADEFRITNNEFVIVSIGELNDNKNHKLVINALSNFADIQFKYLICGEGKNREYLQQLIEKKGLKDKVKLLGFRSDVKEVLSLANLFIFPSKREGLPVSVIEAMASKLPIVASKIRGNIDLIDDYDSGLLFNSDDEEDLLEKLKISFSNNQLLEHLSMKSLEKVQIYSLDNVLKELKLLYDSISY